jgi:hypothetical protein
LPANQLTTRVIESMIKSHLYGPEAEHDNDAPNR